MTEGVDQLPIVQHALNQVWHAADNGKEEMDLIHYAMVGGMPVNELPEEQIDRFKKWFEDLTPEIKACYRNPNLQNVLDTHTNKLWEQAEVYYANKTGKYISDEDAKSIIKTAFICLTKIDQGRAVRNRMTLKEIVNLIGRPEFGTKEVGDVLNIFREPGNTFLRPFILDDAESQNLNEEDVLDITHESLIRNWVYLGQWAKEEFDNYTISLDFEQQLNRWVESDKSNDFLLPIGPLTYFENWFKTAKPNAYWIARYLPEEIEQDKKLSNAAVVLSNAKEFLKRSAGKHVVTRTIMRFGPKRIAALLGIIVVIFLSSFGIRDYFRKQNYNVLKSIKEKTFELANTPKLSPEFPIPVITEQLILGNLTIPEVIDAIKEPKQKIFIATGIASQLVIQGRYEPKNEILQSLTIADSLLEQLVVSKNGRELSEQLKLIHDFSVTAGFALFFNQEESLKSIVLSNAKRSGRWAMQIFKEQPEYFSDIQNLSLALGNAINHKVFSTEEINQLLVIISPLENNKRTPWLQKNYQRDKVLIRGSQNYGPRFNGLYQDLAYLYAGIGKPQMVLQCMDTLLKYQENFYQNDYATHTENASNIAAVFHIYNTTNYLDSFVQGYCLRKNISTVEFYNRLVSWAIIDNTVSTNANFYAGTGGQTLSNLNIKFSSDEMLTFFFSKLKEEIIKIKDNDDRSFNLAVVLKNEGVLINYRKEFRGIANSPAVAQYKDAVKYYQQVSKEYLNQSISAIGTTGTDMVSMPRKYLFLYPDYRVSFHPCEPRGTIQFYNTGSFIGYLADHQLFDSLYQNNDEFKYFELWLHDYQISMSSHDWTLRDPMPDTLMNLLASKLEERKANQSANLNILYLHLSDNAFNSKKTDNGIAYLKKIQPEKLLNAFQYKLLDFVNTYSFELVGKSIANLTVNNQFDLAYTFINVFKKEVNRSSLYAYASQLISLNKQSPESAQRLLDSARTEMNRLDNPAAFQPNRHQVAMALMYMDPEKNSAEAYSVIKNSFVKFEAIWRFSKSYAIHENLYKAQQQAPALISAGDKTAFLQSIAEGYNLAKPKKKEWEKFKNNELIFARRFLPFVNENQ